MSKVKGGLGKGLSALIRPAEEPIGAPPQSAPPDDRPIEQSVSASPTAGTITHLELSRIRPNPLQPRADFDQGSLDELKQSIREKGVIQAVTVRKASDGMYELISGERRVRASNELGLANIPAYVIEVTSDAEMLELALVENLQREHLNPIEIAISYQRLSSDIGLSAEEIAKKVSKDRSTVVNFLRLLKLPEQIKTAVRRGKLSTGHARALLGITDEAIQLKIFERVMKNDLSVRQVETLARDLGKPDQPKRITIPKPNDSAVNTIESKIRQILATKVKVNISTDGKGEITIEFYSADDLGRIFDLLSMIRS
ncbi:MAG TPA: ParB/RepB/Spo0J family partition protein [Bacteroidota bacterium]|nr:ParB/RepB/Spo0J family partition protein [Bacteroidota bacterium]